MWYYISGGERSGKTAYGMSLADTLSRHPVYLATARILDKSLEKRVQHHMDHRPDHWQTITCEKYLSAAIPKNKVILVDCVTLWIANFFFDYKEDEERTLQAIHKELAHLKKMDNDFIFVSNEIGMGLHGNNHTSRAFASLQGLVNQKIAAQSEKAFLMVSGIPIKIKG